MFGRSKVKAASVFAAASHSSPIGNSPGGRGAALSRVNSRAIYHVPSASVYGQPGKGLTQLEIPNESIKPRLICSFPALYSIIWLTLTLLTLLLASRQSQVNTSLRAPEPSFIRSRVSSRRMLNSQSNTWYNFHLSTTNATTSPLSFRNEPLLPLHLLSPFPYLGQVSEPSSSFQWLQFAMTRCSRCTTWSRSLSRGSRSSRTSSIMPPAAPRPLPPTP